MLEYEQLEISPTWLSVGDRAIVFEGLPSQQCGTVVGFIEVFGCEGLHPVIFWDNGYKSVASYAWRLRRLEEEEQLSLFLE